MNFSLRFATATAISLIGLTAASAEDMPTLIADISVDAAIVTVGDMFANAGINAERPLFRAPAPGTTGSVSVAAIKQAANRAGLTDYSLANVTTVQVHRAGVDITIGDLEALITGDLQLRGIMPADASAQIRFFGDAPALTAATTGQPVELTTLHYIPGASSFTAKFMVAGYTQPVTLEGQVEFMVEVPHLKTNLAAGTVITPDDLELRAVPLRVAESSGTAMPEELVGMAIKRPSRTGMMLRVNDVEEPQIIARSELITLRYQRGPLTLTIKGQALNAAAAGETVSVLNLVSKKIVHGVATDYGLVELIPDTVTTTAQADLGARS